MSADNPDNDECEGDGHQINTEGKVVGEVNEPDAGSGGELELDKESLVKQKDSRGRAVLKDKQERSIFQYRWDEMFARLLEFKREKGHCLVPNRYKKDTQLGSWVSVQRQQYKILISGGSVSTSLTLDRAQRLIDIGFCWETKDPRLVSWESRFNKLVDFISVYGHAQVPYGWKENIQLATWVCTQRQEYKLHKKGRPSRLTSEKIDLLDAIGFTWKVEKGCRRKLIPVPENEREEIVSVPKDSVITAESEPTNLKNDTDDYEVRYKNNPRVLPQGEMIRLPRRVADSIESTGGIRSEPLQYVRDKDRKPATSRSSSKRDDSSFSKNRLSTTMEHPNVSWLRQTNVQQAEFPLDLGAGFAPDAFTNLVPPIGGNGNFPILMATQNGLHPIATTAQMAGFAYPGTANSFNNSCQSPQAVAALNAIAALATRNNNGNSSAAFGAMGFSSNGVGGATTMNSKGTSQKRKRPPTNSDDEVQLQNQQLQLLLQVQQQGMGMSLTESMNNNNNNNNMGGIQEGQSQFQAPMHVNELLLQQQASFFQQQQQQRRQPSQYFAPQQSQMSFRQQFMGNNISSAGTTSASAGIGGTAQMDAVNPPTGSAIRSECYER